jgi:hypothetical protein
VKTIEVTVSIGLVGCKRSSTIEVEDDMTDDEIEEEAREAMFNLIEWGWSWVDEAKTKRSKR